MLSTRIALCIYSTSLLTNTTHGISFKQVRSFFGATPFEQVVEKDYTLNPDGRIILYNIHGNIVVKTGLDKHSVAVRADKHAAAEDDFDHMHLLEEEKSPNRLVLRTTYDSEKVKGMINYALTVPDNAHIEIYNGSGNIDIQDVKGTIYANPGNGNTTVYNPKLETKIDTTQQGNITVIRPAETVQLSTNKGNVQVIDSSGSVGARAKNGKVEVKCKVLPAKNYIKLATQQGPITLHTPKTINCSITAETDRGTVTGSQEITLDPVTVKLNDGYWNTIKRSIKGTIGKAVSEVKMFSKSGNINILKY